ncbi:MAG: hypothetical protein ACF8MJ_01905 [Phycisphaerales bacterium JB050]
MFRSVFVASLALAGISHTTAYADFIAPDADTYGWDRGVSEFSTYAEWDVFTSPTGPNTPDVGLFFGGPLPDGAPAFNAFDSGAPDSGSFVTGGGNIYSFSGIVKPQVDFGGYNLGDNSQTVVLLQVRTLGTEFDANTVFLNGSIAPTSIVELAREDLGGFGGAQVDTLFRFDLSGNTDSYSINFDALGSSMSLDRIALDTFTHVPTPGASMILGLAGLAAIRRRR